MEHPTLHLYIELSRTMNSSEQSIQEVLSKSFSAQFPDFNNMKEILGIDPLKVTVIPEGSFSAYIKSKLAAGADLAHLKPAHMRTLDESLKHLLSVSKD